MSTETKVKAGLELVRAGLDAASGNPNPRAIASAVVDAALEFIPVEELRDFLDAAAIARAEAAANLIEDARFPKKG